MMTTPAPDDDFTPAPDKWREVKYRHTSNLPTILRELRCSLLVSTYQAGKLLAIGTVADDRVADSLRESGNATLGESCVRRATLSESCQHGVALHFSFHNFDQAMGIAASPRRLAVGAKGAIWFHDANPEIAPTLAPAGQFDRCYLARRAHVTGGIHCHEMAWDADGELWVVNTLFSCLATLDDQHSFVPRWSPRYISQLAGEDRCHLNGLAMRDGRPALVTMMAETDEPAGWRPRKESTGLVMDLASGEAVTRGLAMPHSPRWRDGRLWVLNSGCGTLEVADLSSGKRDVVESFPGYTRGLAFCGPVAFVGLSRIRETAVFGGLPIAAQRAGLKCGVGVVDLRTGRTISTLEFESGVEEIFDVQVLPETLCPALCGPRPDQDNSQDIWIVPRPDVVDELVRRRGNPPPLQGEARGGSAGRGQSFEEAASKNPSPSPSLRGRGMDLDRESLVRQALELQSQRRVGEAIALLEQAARLAPPSATVLNHLGNAHQDAGDQLASLECYRQAVRVDPSFGPALQNLGYVLVAQGWTDDGRARLREAQVVQPADVNHVLVATAMPIVYESAEEVHTRRAEMVNQVQRLAAEGLRIDTTRTLVPTNFFAAYHGENDRDLHADLGRIYEGVDATCPGWLGSERSEAPRSPRSARNGKLRVGFLSAYFRDHTIGRLNVGRIERLPPDRFERVVLSVGRHDDPLAERFRRAADRYVALPRDVAEARRLVAEERLDLLFFADVGMDALSYTLAFSRMAPVQVATWGHPVTTGSRTMDAFLSSRLLETIAGRSHYVERLLLPPSLATWYERPRITGARKKRRDFGLPTDGPLVACPQTLFKFHPDFDAALAGVLRQIPGATLALIEGRTANWTRQLKARFARVMPDVVDRIAWLPALANDDFLQLVALADASLDTFPFGGGNTSYEALAMGTPVVTLPGSLLRNRITRALYAKMAGDVPAEESLAPLAATIDAYVQRTAQLVEAGRERDQVREWIAERAGVLFEDDAEVVDFAAALEDAAAGSRSGPPKG